MKIQKKRARKKNESFSIKQKISAMRLVPLSGNQIRYANLERMGLPLGVQKSFERMERLLNPLAFTLKKEERVGAWWGHRVGRARRLIDRGNATQAEIKSANDEFCWAMGQFVMYWEIRMKLGADFIRGFSRALDYELGKAVVTGNQIELIAALAQLGNTDARELIDLLKANNGRVGYKVAEFILSKLPSNLENEARRQFQTDPKRFVRRLRKDFERLGFVAGRTRREALSNH